MGYTFKLLLLLFVINSVLYFGGYKAQIDTQGAATNVLGLVYQTSGNSLNASYNNPQASSSFTNVVPISNSSGLFTSVGNAFGALYTATSFGFGLVNFIFGFLLAPLAIFHISGMPFIFKIVFAGMLLILEVVVMISLLTGRDL